MKRKNTIRGKNIYNKIENNIKSDMFIKIFGNTIIILSVLLLSFRSIFMPENGLYFAMSGIMNDYLSFIISMVPVIIIIMITLRILNRKNSKLFDKQKFIENINYVQNNLR